MASAKELLFSFFFFFLLFLFLLFAPLNRCQVMTSATELLKVEEQLSAYGGRPSARLAGGGGLCWRHGAHGAVRAARHGADTPAADVAGADVAGAAPSLASMAGGAVGGNEAL